jgi:hypothetical protein
MDLREWRLKPVDVVFRLVDGKHLLTIGCDGDVIINIGLEELECPKVGIRFKDDRSANLRGQESTLGRKTVDVSCTPIMAR